MAINKTTNFGNINITKEAISTLVGGIVTECYGVVGMASKNIFKDGIAELLKYENYSKGVIVSSSDDGIKVDLYIIIGFGVKVSEITTAVQTKVKYMLEKTLQTEVKKCNVYVQGIRVIN